MPGPSSPIRYASAARALEGAVFVALHRFADARTLAAGVLAMKPDDPGALATLGDAAINMGDLSAARVAYAHLSRVAPSAAAFVRTAQVDWLTGDTAGAIRDARAAVAAADEEGAEPGACRLVPDPRR